MEGPSLITAPVLLICLGPLVRIAAQQRSDMAINTDRLDALLGKAVVDFGATFHAALVRGRG